MANHSGFDAIPALQKMVMAAMKQADAANDKANALAVRVEHLERQQHKAGTGGDAE